MRRKVYNVLSSDEDADDDAEDNPNGTLSKTPSAGESMEEVEDEIERKIEKYAYSPKTRKSMGIVRDQSDSEDEESEDESSKDNSFNIRSAFSSTLMVPKGGDLLHHISPNQTISDPESASEDSVVLLEAKVPLINISDESPETTAIVPVTPGIKTEKNPSRDSPAPAKLVQSRITDKFTPSPRVIRVPKAVYEEQVQKLGHMETHLKQQENLFKTVGRSMVDGGKKLLERIGLLQQDTELQRKSVEQLAISPGEEDGEGEEQQEKENRSSKANSLAKIVDWDDLEQMMASEKPKHFGKQGIKTFETQKAVTLDTLKEIHGSLSTRPLDTVMVETPRTLKVQLMPHQRHALAFMLWREAQRPRGGLLADDMGLGKTLTMLSLISYDMQRGKMAEEEEESDDDDSDKDDEGAAKPTKKKTMAGWSAKGRRDHYAGGTLVVCPASLLQQWEGEVKSKMARNSLNYLVYHGPKRDSRGRYLCEHDLVITTYSIASVDKKTNIGLYRVKWRRIILDEGHAIRNHKSQMSMAACDLLGRRRWVLTGTPIHNKEMDIFAVLKFIRCQPFDDLLYFKKWIDNKTGSGKERLNTLLKSIMLRRTKAELQAKGALQSLPPKTCDVIEVRLDKDEMAIYQRVVLYSKTLFAQFLHQRSEKQDQEVGRFRARDPARDPNEKYFALYKRMARMTKAKGEVQQHQILVLLLRLRQVCCHPGLINAMLDNPELADSFGADVDGSRDHSEMDLLNQLEKLNINESGGGGGGGHGEEEEEDSYGEEVAAKSERILVPTNPVFSLERPSSKMQAVLEKIEELLAGEGDDKIVVVSQWSSVLDILEGFTRQRKIHTTKLTGQVIVQKRGEVVDSFNEKGSGPRILFLSLTAGGVGLNLVGGNHLILVDLHWNPQLEQQAQDRVYRFGQEKPVKIYKYVVADSIEQRIQTLQEQKLALAEAVLTGSKAASGSKLTIADLKMLFDMV